MTPSPQDPNSSELDCSDFNHEQTQRILNWHTQSQIQMLERLLDMSREYSITDAEAVAHNTGYDGLDVIPASIIRREINKLSGGKV